MKIGLFFSRSEGITDRVVNINNLARHFSRDYYTFIVDDFFKTSGLTAMLSEIEKNVFDAVMVLKDNKVEESLLNQVEMAIRCYDPCLSCATHQIGKMPLEIQLIAPGGEVVKTVRRDA